MSTVALAKPVRVIRELTPTQLIARKIDRATQIRDAAHERADTEWVERVEQAVAEHRTLTNGTEAETPESVAAEVPTPA